MSCRPDLIRGYFPVLDEIVRWPGDLGINPENSVLYSMYALYGEDLVQYLPPALPMNGKHGEFLIVPDGVHLEINDPPDNHPFWEMYVSLDEYTSIYT